MSETKQERVNRILSELKAKYPDKNPQDLDGRGEHFFCEIEPATEHPEYDRTIEVIISSKPHKHNKMTQTYTLLKGNLSLFTDGKENKLSEGDTYVVKPGEVHWATSENEAWLEIYSEPGWTPEDHIVVEGNLED